jgi:hypothetical protein
VRQSAYPFQARERTPVEEALTPPHLARGKGATYLVSEVTSQAEGRKRGLLAHRTPHGWDSRSGYGACGKKREQSVETASKWGSPSKQDYASRRFVRPLDREGRRGC